MRIGFPEIVLIIAIVILIPVFLQVLGAGRGIVAKNKTSANIPDKRGERRSIRILGRLKIVGIALFALGFISLLAGLSMFKWVYWSYLWSLAAIVVGCVIVFISLKR